MIFGAKSYHSIPTPSLNLRATSALITAVRVDGGGSAMLTSMRVFRRKSESDVMSAPLKLRFCMRALAPVTRPASTRTGILTLTRSPHRCSGPFLIYGMKNFSVSYKHHATDRRLTQPQLQAGRHRAALRIHWQRPASESNSPVPPHNFVLAKPEIGRVSPRLRQSRVDGNCVPN